MKVGIVRNGGVLLRSPNGVHHRINSVLLEETIPGFKSGRPTSLKIDYVEPGVQAYSYYKGGRLWLPAYPPSLPRPKGQLTIGVAILLPEEFLGSLPKISLVNQAGLKWMPTSVKMVDFVLGDKSFVLRFLQEPSNEGVSEFSLVGEATKSLGWNADGTYLQFKIFDMFGQNRILRVYHKGFGRDWLGLEGSMGFERVCLMSFDGSRLRLITRAGSEFSAATLYLRDPSDFINLNDRPSLNFKSGKSGIRVSNPPFTYAGNSRPECCIPSRRTHMEG